MYPIYPLSLCYNFKSTKFELCYDFIYDSYLKKIHLIIFNLQTLLVLKKDIKNILTLRVMILLASRLFSMDQTNFKNIFESVGNSLPLFSRIYTLL